MNFEFESSEMSESPIYLLYENLWNLAVASRMNDFQKPAAPLVNQMRRTIRSANLYTYIYFVFLFQSEEYRDIEKEKDKRKIHEERVNRV